MSTGLQKAFVVARDSAHYWSGAAAPATVLRVPAAADVINWRLILARSRTSRHVTLRYFDLIDYYNSAFPCQDLLFHVWLPPCSAVVLEESPCPRGPIYKSLSLNHKVLENFQGLRILQTLRYKDTVKNALLTDVRCYLLIYVSQ